MTGATQTRPLVHRPADGVCEDLNRRELVDLASEHRVDHRNPRVSDASAGQVFGGVCWHCSLQFWPLLEHRSSNGCLLVIVETPSRQPS